jgi:hypothetical protein
VLGMGEGKVRYRTSFLPKNRSGSGEVISAGTFRLNLPNPKNFINEFKVNTYLLAT